jgi:hypothetical protein
MQRMFAEATAWKSPWFDRVLPNIVAIAAKHPERADRLHPRRSGTIARRRRGHVAAVLRTLEFDDDR